MRHKQTASDRMESGAAVIEFALLVPVWLLLVTGIMAYAIYFGAAHSIQQLAADAARTSIAGLNATERNDLVQSFMEANAADYLFVDPEALTYAIGQSPDDPHQYDVIVSYDTADLPIWNLYLPLPLPAQTIRYVSTIRHGGV